MLGFPVSELEENRLHSFKQEREEGKKRRAEGKGEGDKEGEGRRRTGKEMSELSVTEPTEEICKIGKEILFFLGDF